MWKGVCLLYWQAPFFFVLLCSFFKNKKHIYGSTISEFGQW
ncbi:hypothetical protein BACCOP_02060 [Phocaeicola coprocola DSM 17136]|uniref:Uncharacterized protein n=1 Tax=Phocaeicola coprocola DSM 17136 TaxID=470145 RepID=B3JJJ0_9BACT|nr:hypothetical protein BACCOP_02060 [Phocaeicola coprocola DSM 17136]